MTASRKPTAGFWITVALIAALVGYPLSFGPACWISSRTDCGVSAIPYVYWPMTRAMSFIDRIADVLGWYARLGSPPSWKWLLYSDWTWIDTSTIAPP